MIWFSYWREMLLLSYDERRRRNVCIGICPIYKHKYNSRNRSPSTLRQFINARSNFPVDTLTWPTSIRDQQAHSANYDHWQDVLNKSLASLDQRQICVKPIKPVADDSLSIDENAYLLSLSDVTVFRFKHLLHGRRCSYKRAGATLTSSRPQKISDLRIRLVPFYIIYLNRFTDINVWSKNCALQALKLYCLWR